jgi:hypothetical protein
MPEGNTTMNNSNTTMNNSSTTMNNRSAPLDVVIKSEMLSPTTTPCGQNHNQNPNSTETENKSALHQLLLQSPRKVIDRAATSNSESQETDVVSSRASTDLQSPGTGTGAQPNPTNRKRTATIARLANATSVSRSVDQKWEELKQKLFIPPVVVTSSSSSSDRDVTTPPARTSSVSSVPSPIKRERMGEYQYVGQVTMS